MQRVVQVSVLLLLGCHRGTLEAEHHVCIKHERSNVLLSAFEKKKALLAHMV